MRLERKHIDAGLLSGKVPYIRAVILFGANALFKRLDTAVSAHRYARQVARLLPPHFRFTILGYEDVPSGAVYAEHHRYGLGERNQNSAREATTADGRIVRRFRRPAIGRRVSGASRTTDSAR